jgi:hypothetical protein
MHVVAFMPGGKGGGGGNVGLLMRASANTYTVYTCGPLISVLIILVRSNVGYENGLSE